MQGIKIDGVGYSGPQSWNEMTAKQIEQVFALNWGDPLGVIRMKLMRILFNIPYKKFLGIAQFDLPKMDGMFDFLLKEEKLFKNPFPIIGEGTSRLIGPADNLENITFGEWIFADHFFTRYIEFKDNAVKTEAIKGERAADFLLTTLWRERKSDAQIQSHDFNGDERVKFNKAIIERRLPVIEAIPAEKKQAMIHFFHCCRQRIVLQNPELFAAPVEKPVKRYPGTDHGWIEVLLGISGTKFGTVAQTEEVMLVEVFMELKRIMRVNKN